MANPTGHSNVAHSSQRPSPGRGAPASAWASATVRREEPEGGSGRRRRRAEDPAPASRTTDPRVPRGRRLPPSLAPSSARHLPPALVVLAGSARAEFQRKSELKREPARTWEGEEEREEEGAQGPGEGGIGAGGRAAQDLPRARGWGGDAGGAPGRGTVGSIPGAEPPSATFLRRSPPSSAAASTNPPFGGISSLPSARRPVTPRASPRTRDLPCARCPPEPRGFPFPPSFSGARRSDPPSPGEGEGEGIGSPGAHRNRERERRSGRRAGHCVCE